MKCPHCNKHIAITKVKNRFDCPHCKCHLEFYGGIAWHISASILFLCMLAFLYGLGIEKIWLLALLLVSIVLSYWVTYMIFARAREQKT